MRTWEASPRRGGGASMKNALRALAAVALGVALGTGGLLVHAAPAQAKGEYARCTNGITVSDWTGKNPKNCTSWGGYWLYDSTGKAILKISKSPATSPVWTAISQGYTAAQRWCSNNSATCTVIGSAAVAYVQYVLTNPRS